MDDPLPKFILLVPLRYNDGREVPNEVILDFQDQLFALGGGFTIAGTVEGAYRMADGRKQIDHSLQIWIGLREEDVPELELLVAEMGGQAGAGVDVFGTNRGRDPFHSSSKTRRTIA